MELGNINYDVVKERLLVAKKENEDLIESIKLMDTPLSEDNYEKLLRLVLGDDVDSSKINSNYLFGVLNNLQISLLIEVDDSFDEISEIASVVQNQLSKGVVYTNSINLHDDVVEDEADLVEVVEDEVDLVDAEIIEELEEELKIEYKNLIEDIKFRSSLDSTRIEEIEFNLKFNDGVLNERDFSYIVYLLLGKEINFDKVDSRELAKFVFKISSDFKKIRDVKRNELDDINELLSDDANVDNAELNADKKDLEENVEFYDKWCRYLNDLYEPIKNSNHKLESFEPKYKIKYVGSNVKRMFNFKAIEPKKFLESLKKYGKYAVVGAGVGLVGATIIPSAVISGVGTVRLVYSTAKLANRIVSKGFLNGEPTVVDKVINLSKDKIKNFEINKKVRNLDTGEKEVVRVKFSDTRLYGGINKINNFLKKPETQWFINGAAIGYKIGDVLNLSDKFREFLQSRQNTIVTVPNETLGLETEAPNSSVTEPTVPQEDIMDVPSEPVDVPSEPVDVPSEPVDVPSTEIIDTPDFPDLEITEEIDYGYLDTGDNIDLSGVKQGFTNAYSAMNDQGAVNLITKYAELENGTFIRQLRLSDGSVFTGNIGELLETGVDPSKIAACVSNQYGDYAWMNLEDVLEVLSKTVSKVKVR